MVTLIIGPTFSKNVIDVVEIAHNLASLSRSRSFGLYLVFQPPTVLITASG